MTLALSAKAFSVSAPSIWILYVTVDLGTFMCTLILNCLTLLVVNMKTLPSHCHYVPLIHLRHMALYKCVFDLIWAYCGTCSNSTAKSAVQINVAFLNGPLYQAAYVQCTCMRIILPVVLKSKSSIAFIVTGVSRTDVTNMKTTNTKDIKHCCLVGATIDCMRPNIVFLQLSNAPSKHIVYGLSVTLESASIQKDAMD